MMKPSLLLTGCLLALAGCRHESPAPTPAPAPTPTPVARPVVKADFTIPASAEATVAVAFQSISQNASSYRWSFGDGSTNFTAAPTHAYAKEGTYVVTLRAYDAQRQDSALSMQSIVVSPYNVLGHIAAKVSGTYDCQVYRSIRCYNIYPSPCQSSFVRQRDTVLVVTATGLETLKINTVSGRYAPNEPFAVDPHGPNYQFLLSLNDRGMAHFYTTGDSLLLTQQSHAGHVYSTTDYYRGRRRP